MVTRRPAVIHSGFVAELPVGDTISADAIATQVVAGSGLVGGGAVLDNFQIDLALAPNPSGIIYVDSSIGFDGATQIVAEAALASSSVASFLADSALASGNSSLTTANAALASGNAALDLVPTLGGDGTVAEFTAASAIASGYAVGLDDAGKVQSIASAVIDNSNPMSFPSSEVVFESASVGSFTSTYDSVNNRVVIAYADGGNSNYGTAIVGTVSGSTISFGTAVVFQSSTTLNYISTFDSSNSRVVITYRSNDTNWTYSIVGTVSGSSISFGSRVLISGSVIAAYSTTFDSTNNKVILSYKNNSGLAVAQVGTVTGSSISYGAASASFGGSNNVPVGAVYDSSNNRVVITCLPSTNYGGAAVGTVSGTSISVGTVVIYESAPTSAFSPAYDSTNNRVVISYSDGGNSSYGTAIVGTVSGSTISFGTAVVFESAAVDRTSCIYDSVNSRIIVSYRDVGNSNYGTAIVGTVSGSTISFGTPVVFDTTDASAISSIFNSTNNCAVISYQDAGNSNYGTSIVADSLFSFSYTPTLNSYPNFIGLSQSTVVSGSNCFVNLPGFLYNEPAANLTTGSFYYIDTTTSGITTSSTKPTAWNGQVPWSYIGRAVTTSGLMLLKSI